VCTVLEKVKSSRASEESGRGRKEGRKEGARERLDALVQHDVAPHPAPRHRQRVQQVPEQVLLPEHDLARVVDAQAVREPEVLALEGLVREGRERRCG